jgi:hypothetical protein
MGDIDMLIDNARALATRETVAAATATAVSDHLGLNGQPCQCAPARRRKMLNFSVCLCHGAKHAECPDAESCIGGCGRKTTPSETNMPGYCTHCAADRRWIRVA